MKNYKGGDLIGQGSYGCVFKPPLKCEKNIRRPRNKVTKLINYNNAVKELEEFNKIESIDKSHKYHLPKPHVCKYNNIYDNEPGMEKCKFLKNKDKKNLVFIQYKDGGIELESFLLSGELTSEKNIKDFLLKFYDLIYGLAEMNNNDFIHNDIKSINIVINPKNYDLNYIDFGLSQSIKTKKSLSEREIHIYSASYFAYPTETFLLNPVYFNNIKYRSELLDFTLIKNKLVEIYNESNNYTKYIDNFYIENGSLYLLTDSLLSKYIELIKEKDYETFIKELLLKIDVFSLGLVLIQCYYFIFRKKYNLSENVDRLYGLEKELYILIKRMIEPIYNDRMSGEEVKSYYKTNIMPLLKKEESIRSEYLSNKSLKSPKRSPILSREELLSLTKTTEELMEIPIRKKYEFKKKCPEGKILNPLTDRCVKKDGRIGRSITRKKMKIIHKRTYKRRS